MFATSSPPVCHTTSLSYNPSILFFLHLWLALWWKTFVFLSLVGSKIDLNLCRQKTSSWCSSSLTSFFTPFILSIFYPNPPRIKSANSPCLASNLALVLPKVRLLHAIRSIRHFFIFSKRQNIGLPCGWAWLHESQIMFSQLGCVTNFSLKRCIRRHRRWGYIAGARFNRIESWSE